ALAITSDDPNNGSVSYSVSGAAVTPPKMTLTPGALAFGTQAVNSAAQLPFTVKNDGGAALNVTVGALSAPFRVVSGGGAFSLQQGSSQQVMVEFKPTQTGNFSAALAITSNDPNNQTASYQVTGTGVPPGKLTLTPSALAFGNQVVN